MPGAPHPLVIIGLDGATFDIIDPLVARGELPNLSRLMGQGLRTILRSTLPPATFPAWTSFLTAAEPGQHGITDILLRHGYGLVPANATLRAGPTFLRRLSEQGYRVASLGVPGTYPPEAVAGICVAGFDAPDARRAGRGSVWPPDFWAELEALGGWRYATFNEYDRGPARLGAAVASLLADLDAKEKLALELFRSRAWDLFFIHLQAADTAGHHLWHTFDRQSPRRLEAAELSDSLLRIYGRLDTLIGRLLASAPAAGRTLVVSDHGMGGASTTAVHLNCLLHHLGLLRFAPGRAWRRVAGRGARGIVSRLPLGAGGLALRLLPRPVAARAMSLARAVAVDFSRSHAFSDELDYAPSIWLNRRGVFPNGMVTPGRVGPLLDRITDALRDLHAPGSSKPLINAVHRRETVCAGPHCDRAPDLIIEPAWPDGYRPSFLASAGPGPVVRRLAPAAHSAPKGEGMPGVHRREGIFVAHGPGLRATEIPMLRLAEAGALVFALMGLPLPAELAVQPPGFCAELLPIAQLPPSGPGRRRHRPHIYTPEEAAKIEHRLRALGYLE